KGTTGNRTSWGSWRLPTAPAIRDRSERLYVFRTEHALRGAHDTFVADGDRRVSPLLSSALFTELTQDVWRVAPESATRLGHPAPYPVELVRRIIALYGWPGCVVLDPFAGSGSTGIAAVELGCSAVLADRSEAYCRASVRRLMEVLG